MLHKYLVSLAVLGFALSACSGPKGSGETVVTGVSYIGATVDDLDKTTEMYTSSADVQNIQAV